MTRLQVIARNLRSCVALQGFMCPDLVPLAARQHWWPKLAGDEARQDRIRQQLAFQKRHAEDAAKVQKAVRIARRKTKGADLTGIA